MLLLLTELITILILTIPAIEIRRYHWLSFDELPDDEQHRLKREARTKPYNIGGKIYYPDPGVFKYYTKIKRRS